MTIAGKDSYPCTDISVHFLSSGSCGNCTLVRDGREAFVIDFGLPAQLLAQLLRHSGIDAVLPARRARKQCASEGPMQSATDGPRLQAALLTHVHRDHFSGTGLQLLGQNGVRLFAHRNHIPTLETHRGFQNLCKADLFEAYYASSFSLNQRWNVLPVAVPHDSDPTFGFILERRSGKDERRLKISYLADLGYVPDEVIELAADSDLLALEFNHDEQMERHSLRHARLIARVLSPHGHLSNDQAAQALSRILARSRRPPSFLALLHLSEECNRPGLALAAATSALAQNGGQMTRVLVTRPREYAGFADLTAFSRVVTSHKPYAKTAENGRKHPTYVATFPSDLFDFAHGGEERSSP